MESALTVTIYLILAQIEVLLAQGTSYDNGFGAQASGHVQNSPAQLADNIVAGNSVGGPAALGFVREVRNCGACGLNEPVHRDRIFGIVEPGGLCGPCEQAAVVGNNDVSGQWAPNELLQHFNADFFMEKLQQRDCLYALVYLHADQFQKSPALFGILTDFPGSL